MRHGAGWMQPGDGVVVVHVSSAHRAAALGACQFLTEAIKADLPV